MGRMESDALNRQREQHEYSGLANVERGIAERNAVREVEHQQEQQESEEKMRKIAQEEIENSKR